MSEQDKNHYWNEIYIQMLHAVVNSSKSWMLGDEPAVTVGDYIDQAASWTDAAVEKLKPV